MAASPAARWLGVEADRVGRVRTVDLEAALANEDEEPPVEFLGFTFAPPGETAATLLVDVTGQINGETLGPEIYSGTGGAFAFSVGALHAKGGRSVTVLPSTSLVGGERRSRIVAMLPHGSAVTVPRVYADIFVTEYGIARLKGKPLRRRIDELIAIAHPDVRAELRAEARQLYGA